MHITKIIKNIYLIYTIYILMAVSITTMSLFDVLFGIFTMWFTYALFFLGFNYNNRITLKKQKNISVNNWLIYQSKITLLVIASISVISSILAVRYYTGQTPISVVQNLLSGSSLYYEYQNYFKINSIGNFSFSKAPFILMLILVKFILIYSHVSFGIFKRNIRAYEKLYLFAVTFSSIYVGIARGTNFEFFELFVLLFFIMSITNERKPTLYSIKKRFLIIILAIFVSFVFYIGVTARGMEFGYRISGDIYYNPDGIIPTISSFISFLVLLVFDYFGFGFFYMSKFFSRIWIKSIGNFVGGLIPMGTQILSEESILDQMKNTIDMGARWHPDTIVIINNWGIIGFIIFSFLLGLFSNYIIKRIEINSKNTVSYISHYFILMQMIALPVGNFIQVSSSNRMIVFTLGVFWSWKLLKLPKIKIK